LGAEAGALEILITKTKEELAQEAFLAAERARYDAWLAKSEADHIAMVEAREAADAQADSIRSRIFAEDLARMQESAIAEARTTEAKILLANQYADAEVKTAAIVNAARRSVTPTGGSTGGISGGVGIGAGGITPRAFLSGGGMMATGLALFGGYEIVKAAAEFDDAMNKSLSIMGEVSDFQKGQMRESSRQLAEQYGIDSKEIVGAFYDMSSAGMSFQESLKSMPAVAAYAFTASRDGVMSMAKAAEQLTTVYNALKGSGESIEHVSDLLLKADSIAAGTGEQFAQALAGKGAGAIRIFNKSAEEGLAILSTLSQVGIRGANAQTAMIQMLRDLPKEAEKYSDTLIVLNGHQMTYKELLYDSSGQMKNFADILATLEQLFQGASTEVIQHDLALLHLNNRTNQSLQAMLGLSGVMRDYQAQLESADGTTKRIAQTRLESAVTQFKQLREEVKGFAIDLGTLALPPLLLMMRIIRGTDPVSTFSRELAGAVDTYMQSNRFLLAEATRKLQETSDKAGKAAVTKPVINTMTGEVLPPSKSDEDLAAENKIRTTQLTRARDHALQMLEIERNTLEARRSMHEISDQQFLAAQLSIDQRAENAKKEFAQNMLELDVSTKAGERDAKMVAIAQQAEDARATLDAKYKNAEAVRAYTQHEKLLEDIRKFNEKLDNYDQKRLAAKEKMLDAEEKLITEGVAKGQELQAKAQEKAMEGAAAFIKLLENINRIERETATKNAEKQRQYDKLSQTISDMADKDENRTTKAAKQSNVTIQAARQLESEIKTIAGGLSDLILEGGKFGDVMEKAMKQAVKTMLQDLIIVGFGALLRTIFSTGSALNDLGKKLENVWGIGQGGKKMPLPYGGGVGQGGQPTTIEDVRELTKNAEKPGIDATNASTEANKAGTVATKDDATATHDNSVATRSNTTAEESNTRAINILTRDVYDNTAATIANTTALWANTAAIYALISAMALKGVFGGSGGGVNIGVNFGGGGGGGFGAGGGDPYGLNYNWDWLYNLPLGEGPGNSNMGVEPQFANLNAAGRVVIDMRGSTFHGQATEAQTTQMLNHVVDKLRVNRIRV
jgi:TP901 family phage tail tape measure protein